jgi:hypothetical protein
MNVVRSIRNKSRENELISKKEQNWNSRFHLGKLPAYDALSDINCNFKLNRLKHEIIARSNKVTTFNLDKLRSLKKLKEVIIHNKDIVVYTSSKSATSRAVDDAFSDEINIIHSMWDDLGVTESYRNLYESIARELDNVHRKEFIDYEIGLLKKFLDNLNVKEINLEIIKRGY